MNEEAKHLCRFLTAPDAETDFKIKYGTEMYRKGFCRLDIYAPDGTPVKNAQVRVKLTKHDFRFGCNAFMLGQFPEEEKNAQYEEVFASLFNEAVVPFYWKFYEPEDGKLRFGSNSEFIFRRPPPDDVLAYCRKHDITPKGHPLCWHVALPLWVPSDPELFMRRLYRRMEEIAERYGNEIFLWDCVNEAQTHRPLKNQQFPEDYVERSFRMAERLFPLARLLYNDNIMWWNCQGACSPVYLLVSRLQQLGCRVGGLGLQFHMFQNLLGKESDQFLNPKNLYSVLDQFGKLQIPVNLSEVSIISRRDLGNGDLFQELVTERLYRIWFSHPSVEGVTWWNLVDGTAAYAPLGVEQGENTLRAGLVNYDFTLKPAFKVLQRLIKKEWHTDTTVEYAEEGDNVFHGFYGIYNAEIRTDAAVYNTKFTFPKNTAGTVKILLK